MNTEILRGNWHIVKARLKKEFANLTDDDLRYVDGETEELIGRIQRRTGATRERVEQLLEQQPHPTTRRGVQDLRSGPGAENVPGGGWAPGA